MIEDISRQMFLEALNTRFAVRTADGVAYQLELNQVVDYGSTREQEQFSLLFLAPTNAVPWQGIYQLEHPTLGNLDLFLVPVALDANGLQFEAVINRFSDGR
jgi:hypothetical protein